MGDPVASLVLDGKCHSSVYLNLTTYIVAAGLPCHQGIYCAHNICVVCGVAATQTGEESALQWTWTKTSLIDRVLALGHTTTVYYRQQCIVYHSNK